MEAMARPDLNDREGWRAYWDAQGLYWRNEPEIRMERQQTLTARRDSSPTPFSSFRLDRADIEWLLATHVSRGIQGPIDPHNLTHRLREGLNLQGADLRQAQLGSLPLVRANFNGAQLERVNLSQSRLDQANMAKAQLGGANLSKAFLIDVSFRQADLHDVNLTEAHLESANLYQANCRNASLYIAHFEGAYLGQAILAEATIRRAFFDAATSWNDTVFWDDKGITPSLSDARWGETNLATIDWARVVAIGDERDAHSRVDREGNPKTPQKWIDNYRRAVRANRQLAVALRGQGMNEEADRFAYQAQFCQRLLYRRQHRYALAFGSRLLDVLAGYGYKPMRTLIIYVLVIVAFAAAYRIAGLSYLGASIFSITSFHGRGFFPNGLPLESPVTVLAAGEAILGLIIEASFIATFTQRFFSR